MLSIHKGLAGQVYDPFLSDDVWYSRKGLHRDLSQNQGSTTTLQGQKGAHSQHHQRGVGGHQNSQKDTSQIVLTVDKGVALVVMDKSQYIDKCMALLDDTKVYKPCKDTTNQLAKFLTKILQRYTGITPTFVKDSKCFSEYLRTVCIGKDEELVSVDVSALFTSIPVPTALDVINHLFIEHIEVPKARGKYGCSFKQNTIGLTKDEVMKLLKLILENCVFSFQGNFFKQLHGAATGSPHPPVVANIYMEYFKDMALGPELLLPIKEWKRYMDDVFSIIPKGQCNTMLQYLNSIDPHIKFTVEQPNEEGAIPFLS